MQNRTSAAKPDSPEDRKRDRSGVTGGVGEDDHGARLYQQTDREQDPLVQPVADEPAAELCEECDTDKNWDDACRFEIGYSDISQV